MVETKKKSKSDVISLWTLGASLQVLAAVLWIPQAWVLAIAINSMATQESVWQTALNCSVWFVILGVLRAVFNTWGIRASYLKARMSLSQLRESVLATLCLRSPLDITRPISGQIASALGEQAELVVPYWARYQPVRLKMMIVPPMLLMAVLYHSWLAALILLCAAPLIPLFMILIGFGARKASENQIIEIGQMNGFLLDKLRGLSTIRAFDGVALITQRLREVSEAVRKKTMKVLSIAFLSSAVMELFSSLGVAMVAVYIGFHLLNPEYQVGAWGVKMTLGQGMFILLLTPTFFDPLRELSAVWHDRASGVAALDGLKKLQEQGTRVVGQASAQTSTAKIDVYAGLPTGALGINVDNLSFQYQEFMPHVVKHFNMSVMPGEKVALVAPSGYGKSTLLALFAGLLPASSGRIEIGGVALTDDTANILRTRMGWISQNPHVFANTMMNNITLGRAHVSKEQLKEAVQASAFAHLLQSHDNRFLGEGAHAGISGGEVLRLALARAMATPELGLLLADEPTAHLDASTAQEVINGIIALCNKGVTLIVATHDERLLPYMDQVIRLEDSFIRSGT